MKKPKQTGKKPSHGSKAETEGSTVKKKLTQPDEKKTSGTLDKSQELSLEGIEREICECLKHLAANYKAGDTRSLLALKNIASAVRDEFFTLAQTNSPDAIRVVFDNAFNAVESLQRLYPDRWELFRHIARDWNDWPGLLSRYPHRKKENEDVLRKLELGLGTGINCGKKPFKHDTVGTACALALKEWLEIYQRLGLYRRGELPIPLSMKKWAEANPDRRSWLEPSLNLDTHARNAWREVMLLGAGLPLFSRATWKKWWEAGEKLFLLTYDPRFEDRDEFTDFWENRAMIDARTGTHSRSRIRSEIKKRIEQGFRSISAPQRQ